VIEDALGHSSYFYYDKSNRLTSSTDPLLHSTYWVYDLNSNLALSRDNNGQAIYFGIRRIGPPTRILRCGRLRNPSYGTTPYGGIAAAAQYFTYDP